MTLNPLRSLPLRVSGVAVMALALGLAATSPQTGDERIPGHNGPTVAPGASGPARFVGLLHEAFDADKALKDARYFDGWYRSPGGEGYDASLEHVAARLRAAGFGNDPRLTLRFLESEDERVVWQPRSASLTLRVEGRAEVLHSFSQPGDRDRVMLPIHAPSADVFGRPVFGLEQVQEGTVLVTDAALSDSLLRRASKRGARAVLSSNLFPFTVDPTGRGRHREAIRFVKLGADWDALPVAQISPSSHRRLEKAAAVSFGTTVALTAHVETKNAKLRTLVAEIVGAERPDEAVVIASHVQEPGAGDNASGVAGITEGAVVLSELLLGGRLEWPSGTIAFVWGDEMIQSREWLRSRSRTPIAGISADMLGQSQAETGAVALLERNKDPGALTPLPPDVHTPWGAGPVAEDELVPNGLALIARSALVDVGRHVGGWSTSENPWEGGSDHDVFLARGIPAILLWHFTDFTYHTSLDRMEILDAEELRRSCVTVLATAMAVADPRPADLERYLASNELELALRVQAAKDSEDPDVGARWEAWCRGAEGWLRELCER